KPFRSMAEFTRRAGLNKVTAIRLANADAFNSMGLNRREALWQAIAQEKELPLFVGLEPEEDPVDLPTMELVEEVDADYRATGMSLRRHPIALLRDQLGKLNVVPASRLTRLPNKQPLQVAGLVLMRQRPSTANEVTFVTLEDETGMVNLIVRPDVWERFRRPARNAVILLAEGRLERKGQVCHVLTHKMRDLTSLLVDIKTTSRDFR
ncbi:MAG: error-prone DNA polymerase, partial [Planctomycetales bacterium]